MINRRRFKQNVPLKDRLATFAEDLREKLAHMPDGREREDLLQRVVSADVAAYFDEQLTSTALLPRKPS
jgi:hypothetical protein